MGPSISASTVMAMDEAGNITRNLDRPPKKDTVTVPKDGFTVLRFHANNPGILFFHCHNQYHSEIGMALIVQVGDHWHFPRRPSRFPRCGSWDEDADKEDIDIEMEEKEHTIYDHVIMEELLGQLEKILSHAGASQGQRSQACTRTTILCGSLYLIVIRVLFKFHCSVLWP